MAGRSWEPFFVRRSDPASVPGIAALSLAGRGRGLAAAQNGNRQSEGTNQNQLVFCRYGKRFKPLGITTPQQSDCCLYSNTSCIQNLDYYKNSAGTF